jgi:hypothetical protein
MFIKMEREDNTLLNLYISGKGNQYCGTPFVNVCQIVGRQKRPEFSANTFCASG